ncbi:MAG TPA: hypothetical protein VFQ71_02055 [Gaiellales bacterium]|jgi:hypothetical protein|nr:hypothetical protein [Gaiellales bacterium]
MAEDAQRRDWLQWEDELRAAMATLREAGGHEDVLRLLEHQATVAMHNAYCAQDIPFPAAGVLGS